MECKVFYFQKNDIKAYNYDSYDNSINQIVSVLNNLNWDSLINEYNNTQKGNRSITQIVRTKVFRLLYSELGYEFTNVDKLSSPRLPTFKIIDNSYS